MSTPVLLSANRHANVITRQMKGIIGLTTPKKGAIITAPVTRLATK